jgi:LPXTG-site transpeptidase (sortase) family protein
VGVHAVVHDPIPEQTSFVQSLVDSGYEVPVGAPKDSTSLGVSCTSSTATVTELCYYEGPTPAYPRGQIIWVGTLGPDLGALTPAEAVNAISITFDIDVKGSTRVENNAFIDSDLNGDGDALDDGERSDAKADFIWDVTPGDLPKTGFAPGQINLLPYQTTSYAELGDIWLEIPKLDIKMPIVGVPMVNNNWDVSWLGSSAGWLNETAYPTTSGNSVITGHVYLPNGQPGPFVELKKMGWNDKLVIHVGDKQYVYRVRKVMQVKPDDLSPLKTESSSWITLVTCQGYDEKTDSYLYRQVVKAELVETR